MKDTESVGWSGELATARWLLTTSPRRVLAHVEAEARRASLGVHVGEHTFRLTVRSIFRNDPSPILNATVSHTSEGCALEFSIQVPFGPLLWILPTLLIGPAVGAALGGVVMLAAWSPENWGGVLVGGLGCCVVPFALLWFGAVMFSEARIRGKARRLLKFLDDTLAAHRLLDAELADEPAGPAKHPWRGGVSRRVLVAFLAVLVGTPIGAVGVYVSERQAEQDRALVAEVRSADPKDLVRISFSPSAEAPFANLLVVEKPAALAILCAELRGGERYRIGKGFHADWSCNLTLEWTNNQTSVCKLFHTKEGMILSILDHRGVSVSPGGGDFKLGSEVKALLDPRELAK